MSLSAVAPSDSLVDSSYSLIDPDDSLIDPDDSPVNPGHSHADPEPLLQPAASSTLSLEEPVPGSDALLDLPIDEQPPRNPDRPDTRARGSEAVKHSILNRFFMLAINASTGILIARALGLDGRGQLAAMILWPGFLASATVLGIPSALIFLLRRDRTAVSPLSGNHSYDPGDGPRNDPRKDPRNDPSVEAFRPTGLIFNGVLMAFVLGLLATLAAEFLLPFWMRQYRPSTIRYAQLFLLTLPLCSVMVAGQAALEALECFTLSNLVQTTIPVATLLALLGFFFAHQLTPATGALSYVGSAIPTSAAVLYLLWRQSRPHRTRQRLFSFASCRLLLGYGIRSCGIDLLGALSIQIDQVLVVRFLAPRAMGAYVVMLSLSRMLGLFQSAVVMVLFPRTAGRSANEVVDLVGRSVRICMLVTASCALVVGVFGPSLIALLYGKEYLSAIGTLRVLLVEITLQGGVFVMAQAFMALCRPGIVTSLQASGLCLSIPAMLFLIPRFGVTGAAIALLISTAARFALIFGGFHFLLRTRLPSIVPGRADFKLLLRLAVSLP